MKTVTIPSMGNPFRVEINGKHYSYPAGTTQTVPDEVASIIDNINANMPKEKEKAGKPGQVWTRQESGYGAWDNVPTELPSGGTTGQFLKKGSSGVEWADTPSYTLPAATQTTLGGVKMSAYVDPTDGIGALIDALITAGIMAANETNDA